MVQIIEENKKPSFAQKLNVGVGRGLEMGQQLIQQHKEKKDIQTENEAAKKLGVDLSGIKDPKMRQKAYEQALQGKLPSQIEAKEQSLKPKYKDFADKIEADNPGSPIHKMVADIYRSDLPTDDKSNLVKSITGLDPFKMDQQRRLQNDQYIKLYGQKIKEIDNELKTAKTYSKVKGEPSEADILKQQKKALQAERDQILNYQIMNGELSEEEIPEEEEDIEEEEEKPKFDPSNKQHKAKAEQLYKTLKDKEKVREALSKEFSGL